MSKDEFVGLEDKGKIAVHCIGCDEKLAEVWDMNPESEEKDPDPSVFMCPFCSGKSKIVDVPFGAALGVVDGIAYLDPQEEKNESGATVYICGKE